ncbi:MAG: EamA family transporter [Alphaproteobacteria bacterium]|nr:MAG: EamA family transporter [Alphaproteobacteria bacterium]
MSALIIPWYVCALLGRAMFAYANIVDSFLANRVFRYGFSPVFYTACLLVVFLPWSMVGGLPFVPGSWGVWFLILLVAFFDTIYLLPYYMAFRVEDTSTVTALYSLGRIFVPVLAWFLIGEHLPGGAYLGFSIIVAGSLLLIWRPGMKLKQLSSLGYVILAAFLVSIAIVLTRMTSRHVDWLSLLFWSRLLGAAMMVLFLIWPRGRHPLQEWPAFRRNWHIVTADAALTLCANALVIYALSVAPATLVVAVSALQPLFVLLFSWILIRKDKGHDLRESMDRTSIMRKLGAFAMLALGCLLIALKM